MTARDARSRAGDQEVNAFIWSFTKKLRLQKFKDLKTHSLINDLQMHRDKLRGGVNRFQSGVILNACVLAPDVSELAYVSCALKGVTQTSACFPLYVHSLCFSSVTRQYTCINKGRVFCQSTWEHVALPPPDSRSACLHSHISLSREQGQIPLPLNQQTAVAGSTRPVFIKILSHANKQCGTRASNVQPVI